MSVPCFQEEINESVRSLKADGVVVLPTDTLYGLAAAVFSEHALNRVFAIKGRTPDMALPVLVAGCEQISLVAGEVPAMGWLLAQRFWPGPLTLVVPRSHRLPDLVTGGRDTVAVRMPNHEVPLAVARQLGMPITGTSANRSGQPDLLTVEAVRAQLGGEVDYIVRSGEVPRGVASTVVDVTGPMPRLLRLGALPFEQIIEACG
jgi:L-threonylcarbamoyladenylate synthase